MAPASTTAAYRRRSCGTRPTWRTPSTTPTRSASRARARPNRLGSRLVSGREAYIGRITDYWNGYVGDTGITRIDGAARFVDARTIEVDGRRYSAEHIVVATGGRPIVPPVPGAELGITSDGFFELTEQPRRVAIIGAGYIGVELAGVLRALGSEVTVVALEARVLETFDEMISDVLMQEMRKQGIALRMCFQVAGLARTDAGIALDASDGERLDGFDTVIWAVGRAPNTGALESGQGRRRDTGQRHRPDRRVPEHQRAGHLRDRRHHRARAADAGRDRRRAGAWPHVCSTASRTAGSTTTISPAWCSPTRRSARSA